MDTQTRLIAVVGAVVVVVIAASIFAPWRHASNPIDNVRVTATAAPSSPGSQNPSDDEAAALGASQFVSPLVLQLNIDGADGAAQAAAMNGVNPKQTYGATYETNSISGCPTTNTISGVVLGISSLQVDVNVVGRWLVKEQFLEMRSFTITYPNAQFPGYGTANTFYCPVFTDAIRQHFALSAQGVDIHHGFSIAVARRVFDRWTFENRYDAQIPGKGDVKMFAGTFAYHFEGYLPGVSSGGSGAGQVKLYRDPDNGQWTIAEYTLTDPTLVLAQ